MQARQENVPETEEHVQSYQEKKGPEVCTEELNVGQCDWNSVNVP